jgi:hypothetical protein
VDEEALLSAPPVPPDEDALPLLVDDAPAPVDDETLPLLADAEEWPADVTAPLPVACPEPAAPEPVGPVTEVAGSTVEQAVAAASIPPAIHPRE